MTAFILPLLIGVIAGLRAMTAPAAISWAARLGYLDLASTSLAFLGYTFTPWIFTVLALGELVTDQLPSTPSRTVPVQFGTRIVVGALTGAAIGAHGGSLVDRRDRRHHRRRDRHPRRTRRARADWRRPSDRIGPPR